MWVKAFEIKKQKVHTSLVCNISFDSATIKWIKTFHRLEELWIGLFHTIKLS